MKLLCSIERYVLLAALGALSACSERDANDAVAPLLSEHAQLNCDDSLKTFKPDGQTAVILVRQFRKGDALTLSSVADKTAPPSAPQDLCLVKLRVGPGSPGPDGAPSTSSGIGIEIWLPARAAWNERIRNLGGGGWAGGDHSSLTLIGDARAALSTMPGYVVGTTDTGHVVQNGSFAVREDGSINRTLWHDFSDRSLLELAIKTKALALAYYGKAQRYAYWEGCSTGGRQGYKMAQEHPEHYDGYLNGAPAINWTRFITGELYPQVVMQRDLRGVVGIEKLNRVSAAAVSACDAIQGQHLGFIVDPTQCRYDPSRDPSVLCKGQQGKGIVGASSNSSCVTANEAAAVNKIWYGQTADGTASDPAIDNATGPTLASGTHLWWGLQRGTNLALLAGDATTPPFFGPFPIASDLVALELQDASYATAEFKNASGNGANRWTELTYADLLQAARQGVSLQAALGNIDTDSPDLTAVRKRGARIITYHGLADELIPFQGSLQYFRRVSEVMGGDAAAREFIRLYLIPGMGHCAGVGSVSGPAGPPAGPDTVPLPAPDQFFDALVSWVEQGRPPPDALVLGSSNGSVTLPACAFPKKAGYRGSGPVTASTSYSCEGEDEP